MPVWGARLRRGMMTYRRGAMIYGRLERFQRRPTLTGAFGLARTLLAFTPLGLMVSMILSEAMPLINDYIRRQTEMRLRVMLREEQKREETRRRELIKEVLAELNLQDRELYRSMLT